MSTWSLRGLCSAVVNPVAKVRTMSILFGFKDHFSRTANAAAACGTTTSTNHHFSILHNVCRCRDDLPFYSTVCPLLTNQAISACMSVEHVMLDPLICQEASLAISPNRQGAGAREGEEA